MQFINCNDVKWISNIFQHLHYKNLDFFRWSDQIILLLLYRKMLKFIYPIFLISCNNIFWFKFIKITISLSMYWVFNLYIRKINNKSLHHVTYFVTNEYTMKSLSNCHKLLYYLFPVLFYFNFFWIIRQLIHFANKQLQHSTGSLCHNS